MKLHKSFTIVLILIIGFMSCFEVNAFKCYICDSKNDIECTENLPENSRLELKDCGNLTNARYCIKTTNLYAGELGTKRFCASNDQGNYCNYVRQPTDAREYRSCVMTCNFEGCNGSQSIIDDLSILFVTLPLTVTLSILIALQTFSLS